MKPVLTKLFLLLLSLTTSCYQPAHPEPADADDRQYTNDPRQARQWFEGKWRLTAVTAMIPNPPVHHVQLVVDPDQITLIQDGRPTDRVRFELIATASGFQLETDAQAREDNWYVRNPGLQVSRNGLFLSTGGSEVSTFRFRRAE